LIGKSLLKRGHLLVELRPLCCLGDWKAVVHILKQHDYMSMFPSSGSSTGNSADVIADAGFDELDRMMRTALNSMAMSIYYLVLTENGACRKGGGSTAEEGIDVSKINVRLDKQRIAEASELFQLHHPPLLDDAAAAVSTKESTYASKYTRATEKAALILSSLRACVSEGDWESVRVKLSSERAAIESDVREERPELEEIKVIRRENLRRQVVALLTLSLGKGGPTIMDSPTSRSTPLDSIHLSSIDVVGLDQGLELASRMDREGGNSSHNSPTEVSKLVSAADVVRRLRVAMKAVHESSLSSRALWNNVKHGLERAREEGWLVRSTSASSDSSFASSDDAGTTSGDALVAARSELRLVSDIVHDREAQISLLEHLSNGSVPSLESVERANSGGSGNAGAGAGVAGGSAGASVLPLLREALEETRRRFPNGAKSTLVRNLLSISEIFYNLRRSFYDSDFQELHSRVGSFVAAGGVAALGAAQGTVGKNLERELIMLKEHDDNHVLLETMSGALRAPGSLCRRSEPVGSLVRWIFISFFI